MADALDARIEALLNPKGAKKKATVPTATDPLDAKIEQLLLTGQGGSAMPTATPQQMATPPPVVAPAPEPQMPAPTPPMPAPTPAMPPAQPPSPGILGQIGGVVSGMTGLADTQAAAQDLSKHVDWGEILGSTAGETAGRIGGAALMPFAGVAAPAMPLLGGAVGSAIGLAISKRMQSEEVKAGDLALEFGLSILPGVVIDPALGAARKILSRTPKGIAASSEAGAKYLRKNATKWFAPESKEVLDNMFTMVRQSGDQLSPSSFTKAMKNLSDTEFDTIHRQLGRISQGPETSFHGIGEAAQKAFSAIREGRPAPGLDLGALTHLRSQIRKQAGKMKEGAAQDSLDFFADILDTGIQSGKFMRGGEARPILAEARKAYGNYMAASDLEEYISRRGITKTTRGGKGMELNLGALMDGIENPVSSVAKNARAALDRTPDARLQMNAFVERMKKVNIESGSFEHSMVVNWVSTILGAGPASRERFLRLVANRRGKITGNELSILANLARRRGTYDEQTMGNRNFPIQPSLQGSEQQFNQGAPQ